MDVSCLLVSEALNSPQNLHSDLTAVQSAVLYSQLFCTMWFGSLPVCKLTWRSEVLVGISVLQTTIGATLISSTLLFRYFYMMSCMESKLLAAFLES